MELRELEVYQLAREISRDAWVMYERLDWRDKKIMGDHTNSLTSNILGTIITVIMSLAALALLVSIFVK